MKPWTEEDEKTVVELYDNGLSYPEIATKVNRTTNSVKHKVRRIKQNNNEDRYKHTPEKIAQIETTGIDLCNKRILETHAGFGGLTTYYAGFTNKIVAMEIKVDRIAENAMRNPEVHFVHGDSEHNIFKQVYEKNKFDIVDIDPYGFPSRYFPHVFHLIEDGYLFLTFPMMGVAQINKLTIEHYRVFWNIALEDKDAYTEKIVDKIKDYGIMTKRAVEPISVVRIDRIYRMIFSVKKESLLKIVGLEVNR